MYRSYGGGGGGGGEGGVANAEAKRDWSITNTKLTGIVNKRGEPYSRASAERKYCREVGGTDKRTAIEFD